MPITLDDYMNPDKFPVTSQGLTPRSQFRIDAFNYDSLVRYQAEDNDLDDEQVEALKELEMKIPAQKILTSEIMD